MDDLYMMGDDPSVYLSPADDLAAIAPPPASHLLDDDDDDYSDEEDSQYRRRRINSSRGGEGMTNSTNQQQMLDVVSNKKNQRKGNRRQNNNSNRNRNSNTQRDSTSSFDDNNPINVISAFNRTGKIYNKLRKNDAVKVIDTPSGRAGFVYQSGNTASSNNNQQMSPSIKESSPNWEDSFSQSSQFANRNANDVKLVPPDESNASNKKILPVLTADGKIALVVRGDTSRQIFDESQNNGSGNSVNTKKYEPITNLTSIITALNSNTDNNNNHKLNDSINLNADGNSELKAIQEQNRLINRLDEFFASVTNKIKHVEEEIEHKLGIEVEEADDNGDQVEGFDAMTTSTTTESFIGFDNDDENRRESLLINRPLSEVLGLPKKTHYHHPHDPFNPSPDMPPTTKLHPENGRRINTVQRTSTTLETQPTTTTTDSSQAEEFDLESPEKINIAVIPRFDTELEERLFGKKNNREMSNEIPDTSGAISSIHCAMQVMVAVACACTVLGVLMSYYRIPLANQFRGIYW